MPNIRDSPDANAGAGPSVSNLVSDELCWILLNRVWVPFVLHLLDPFLLIDPPYGKHGFQSDTVPLSDET